MALTSPEEYQSICYRSETYLQWDGTNYVTDPDLGNKYIDVTEAEYQAAVLA